MKRTLLMALVGTTAMVGAAMVSLPNEAHAVPILQGNTANLSVSGSDGGINVGLDGTVTFTSVEPNSLLFNFSLTNTSDNILNVSNENRVTGFGFSIDGTVIQITDADATGTWSADYNNSGINSFLDVDICVYSGNTCTGGGNTGLFVGDTLNVGVTLSGTFTPPLQFAAFAGRFQSTGPNQKGSLKLDGTVGGGTPEVPEPASLALFGVGLLGLGYVTRRRKQAA